MATYPSMRNFRAGLLPAFLVIGVLLSGIPLGHAHDTSLPGLYSAQCPLYDLGGHAAASPIAAPVALGLDVTPVELAPAAESFVAVVLVAPDAPRAPPRH